MYFCLHFPCMFCDWLSRLNRCTTYGTTKKKVVMVGWCCTLGTCASSTTSRVVHAWWAPPYFLRIVRQHLNQTFGEQWIGRGGPFSWPARSPDLNPMDILLWGHLRSSVYSSPVSDLEVLQQRVENACQKIGLKPGIFDRVRTSV
jgi:hypothetical protein